jgi:hypothetical protein
LLAAIPTLGGYLIGKSVGAPKLPEGVYFKGMGVDEFGKIAGASGGASGGLAGMQVGLENQEKYKNSILEDPKILAAQAQNEMYRSKDLTNDQNALIQAQLGNEAAEKRMNSEFAQRRELERLKGEEDRKTAAAKPPKPSDDPAAAAAAAKAMYDNAVKTYGSAAVAELEKIQDPDLMSQALMRIGSTLNSRMAEATRQRERLATFIGRSEISVPGKPTLKMEVRDDALLASALSTDKTREEFKSKVANKEKALNAVAVMRGSLPKSNAELQVLLTDPKAAQKAALLAKRYNQAGLTLLGMLTADSPLAKGAPSDRDIRNIEAALPPKLATNDDYLTWMKNNLNNIVAVSQGSLQSMERSLFEEFNNDLANVGVSLGAAQ